MSTPADSCFVLGGARSGKSAFAERAVLATGKRPIYLATSRIWDQAHADRIKLHQAKRDASWHLVEVPVELEEALRLYAQPEAAVLVDCLSLWVTNLIFDQWEDAQVLAATQRICDLLAEQTPRHITFVSNEVGMGVAPETKLGNRFRDLMGLVNQRIAMSCSCAHFVVAGHALALK